MWNRWDICLAYYVFAMYFHGGAGTATYSVYNAFHRLRYEPKRMADTAAQHGYASKSMLSYGDEYENARWILAQLIKRHRRAQWEPRRRN